MKQEYIELVKKNKHLQKELFVCPDKNPFECTLELLNELQKAIKSKKPFSMIRLGDGEGRILGYPDVFEDKIYINQVLTYQFGAGAVNELKELYGEQYLKKGLSVLRSFISEACNNADIIGAPSWLHFRAAINTDNIIPQVAQTLCLKFVSEITPKKEVIFDHFIFKPFHKEGYFKILLAGINLVTVVSHTDISKKIEFSFNITHCKYVRVPGHNSFMHSDELHYPLEYKNVVKKLGAENTGDVFLVAAGYLGKYYCDYIKKSGGIAIDIGSIFDGWCGTGRTDSIQNKSHLL